MSDEKIVSLTEQGNYGLGANVISEDEKKKVYFNLLLPDYKCKFTI